MAKSFLVPINLNQLELQNARIQNLASAPASPVKGQVYFNTTTNKAMVYDGTNWIPWEADTNTVTGVKGNSESSYRTGNVNITAANVGAAPTSHASSATTYGTGTNNNYGHVKLSDATDGTAAAASGGTAATPKAVSDCLTAAKNYADSLDTGVSDVKVNNTSVVTSRVANIDLVGTQNTVGVVKNGSSVTSSSGYTASPIISGVPYYKNTTYTAATTASAVSTTSSGGSASTYSKGDHVHSIALATGDNNGQVKIAGSNVSVKGLNNAAYKDVDTSISSGSTSANLPTTAAVVNYVSGVADAMRFKGTLGTGGTITALPTTGVMVGDTYRVITAGTYASIKCEVGDLIIATATTPTWTVAQTNIDGAVTASTTTTDGYLAKFTGDKIVANGPQLGSSTTTYLNNAGNWATPPDTKNTAGSTASDSKLYVIGATNQAANPQTYSNAKVYIGVDDCLYSNGTKVLTAHQTYTSFTGKPTADQTPGFGDTVTISQISQDTSGQVSGTDRTITIPNATATTSAAGLMSPADKTKLTAVSVITRVDGTLITRPITGFSAESPVQLYQDPAQDGGSDLWIFLEDGTPLTDVQTATLAAGQTSVNVTSSGTIGAYRANLATSKDEVVIDSKDITNGIQFSIAAAISEDITITYMETTWTSSNIG